MTESAISERLEVKKREKAAVMVTHDKRVLDLADQVYRLENGKLTPDKESSN